jgi:hypothetical protein
VGVLVACVLTLGACSTARRAAAPVPTTTRPTTSTAPAYAPVTPADPRRPLPTTTTARPAPPKAPTPEFSFDDSVPPPKVINTGHDYVAILESLSTYSNWLASHHPDPVLMTGYIAPGTSRQSDFAALLTTLRSDHAREVEKRGGPNHYTIVSARPDAFSARVVEDVLLHEIVDSRGRVTSIDRFSTPTTYVILAVLVSGHWQVASVDEL